MRPHLTLAFLALTAPALAIDVPESARCLNQSGNCAWANLATLGHVHRIAPLQALAHRGRVIPQNTSAIDENVTAKLNSLGVRHRLTQHGSYDRSLLSEANSRGCIVSCKAGATWCWGQRLTNLHSIVLTRFDENGVEFLCPNNPRGKPWRAGRGWFEDVWAGNALVVDGTE